MEVATDFICGIFLPLLLCLAGIFYLFKLRFFFILHPKKFFRSLPRADVGSLKSLAVALAGTLGIGNIVGVGSAILAGGYGAVFWMVASSFLSMGLKYGEVYLAMRSQRKDGSTLYGGAPYYIYDGAVGKLGKKIAFLLGSLFAVFSVLNSLTTGNLVQISAISSLFPINKLLFGVLLSLGVFFIVLRGRRGVESSCAVIIPLLSAFYIILCLIIILKNFGRVPTALWEIFSGAFSIKSVCGGTLGFGISSAIRYGVSRGLLSNEAGAGTSPLAHASSSSLPHAQACLGIFEVFFDTAVLCTLTALVLVLSGARGSSDAISYVVGAFGGELGALGKYGVYVACLFFAVATVAAQYFYGTESLRFISRSPIARTAFSVVFFSVTVLSACVPSALMWQISDLTLATMTVFNVIAIVLLNKKVLPLA